MPDSAIKIKSGSDILPFYPVGSIYLSVLNVSPATLFGGTWEQIQDCFLLAAGSTYSGGTTGGEASLRLQETELARHNHGTADQYYHGAGQQYLHRLDSSDNNYVNYGWSVGTLNGWGVADATQNNAGITRLGIPAFDTTYTGNEVNNAHNNMPPYLTVYVWKRTA